MTQRIPHAESQIEVRQAFQQMASQTGVITTGASGEILIGAGIGVTPVWQIASTAIDHGSIGGLAHDDHAQYHNDARGDIRYYTKTLLNAGQLDTLYFGEDEFLASSAGAGDAGKPVKLDAAGHIDATMINDGEIDHNSLLNFVATKHFDTTSLTAGSVIISNGTTFIEDNVGLFFNTVSNRLSIGSASPQKNLHIEAITPTIRLVDSNATIDRQVSTLIEFYRANDGNRVGYLAMDSSTNDILALATEYTDGEIRLRTGEGVDRLIIDKDGNVSILENVTFSGTGHNSFTDFVGNEHIDHTGVEIATAATSGISGGGTIAATRNLALNINGLTGESGIVAADTIPFYDDGVGNRKITLTELATALGAADEKVKVDVGATAGYLGVAAGDGVLRTNGTIAWTDGGNFVTLTLSHLGIENLADAGADRILFWDNGASATAWLTVGDGNTISGTTLTGGHTTRCRAYPASDQDIVDSTFTKVTLGTEDFDSGGDFATSTFTAPADGYYLVSGAARTSELMGPGKSFVVLLYKDGVSFSRAVSVNHDGAGSYFLGGVVTDIMYLAATETAELYVWHNHGANRTIDSDPFTFFTVHRLS